MRPVASRQGSRAARTPVERASGGEIREAGLPAVSQRRDPARERYRRETFETLSANGQDNEIRLNARAAKR